MAWTDVFDSSLQLEETVYILAPGPNGVGRYDQIPLSSQVVAVSKAVLIPDVRAAIWMMNHVGQSWYAEADQCFPGIRVFKVDAAAEAARSMAACGRDARRCYSFTPPDEALGLETFMPVDGCIRIGATISACAIQFAYNFGAKEIVLCGVDMSGDGYFDGTVNRHPHHGETWPANTRLNALIRWLELHRGLRFSTLSPTRLDVPLRRHDTDR